MSRRFDLADDSVVVVIGSGAGGGVLSNELAQKGVDVVCLEAGPRLSLSDIVNDEVVMFRRLTWLDPREGSGDLDRDFPIYTCKSVGGTTVHWTGVSLRATRTELKARSTYGAVPNTRLIDWPVDFTELEPFYERAERKMGVAGTHGLPRHPGNNNYFVLKAGAERLGYRDITTANLAINPVARDGRPKCIQLGFCRSGCAIGAKWSTLYTELPSAEATGHFELRPESMAIHLRHDARGRITGVVYADSDGVKHEQKARIVCVAANSIETPRLLINSASSLFPDGIGNGAGNVGRHYMKHVFAGLTALMPGPVNFHRGIQQAGVLAHEGYHNPDRGFAGGYHIETAPLSPERLAKLLSPGGWGAEYTALLEQYDHFAACFVVGEDMPEYENRVTLHPKRKDKYGLPIPVIHYANHANSRALRTHGLNTARAIYEAVGAKQAFEFGAPPSTHNLGTCRMAAREEDGVSDKWGRVFGVPNLFVSDGSQFSTATTANPTLTIVTLAIRQAQYLADQLGKRNL